MNTSYNPAFYEDEKIPMSVLLKDMLMCYKLGIKTLYYFNTNDGQGEYEVTDDDKVEDKETGSSIIDDEDCDSCVL